jgi:hypothetical protein
MIRNRELVSIWEDEEVLEMSLVLVAHACNPSYSGGRDQENHGLKTARANSSQDCISKITNTKNGRQSDSSGRALGRVPA